MATSVSISKDRKVLRKVDQGAAWNSVLGIVAALAVFVLVSAWGGLYRDYEGLVINYGMLILLLAAYRLLVAVRFESLYGAGPARWRRLFALGLLMHAVLWGSFLATVTWLYGIGFNFFAVCLYALGVTTGLSTAWLAGLRARQLYIFLMLVPVVLVLLLSGEPEAMVVAALMLIYCAFLFRMFQDQYETFWHAMARGRRSRSSQLTPRPEARSRDIQLSLVYRLAHELRTPMNSMLGMLSLLEDTRLDQEQREYHTLAAQSGKLLLALINDVLDYSRILTGRIALNPDFFDLRQAVEQCLESYGPIVQDQGQELTCVMDRHLPRRVRGDRERFLQVLNNLISNAIKFSEQGEIRIEVDYSFVPREREESSTGIGGPDQAGQLNVRVIDQGIGMDPATARSLFEDDFSSPGSDPFLRRQRGFGLLVCKGLVEAMAGQIGVTSEPGEGSTFWFTARMPAQPDMRERSPLSKALSGCRVLVAGAAAGTVAALHEELEVLNVTLQSADDHDHALQALREGHREQCDFNLLLVDTRAGREVALNLARTVLEDPALKGVNVLLLATIAERGLEKVQNLVRRHGVAILTRPVHRSGLRSLLGHLYNAEEEVPLEDARNDSQEERSRRRDYRLLLVEDNEVNQIVTRGMLSKLGYQVKAVDNGEMALQLLEREPFDLVLMDCMMPGMDGFEVTRRWRDMEDPKAGRTPVVAMTANTMEGAQARCLAAGMDDFLAKPVHLDQLETMLRHWLPRNAPLSREDDE